MTPEQVSLQQQLDGLTKAVEYLVKAQEATNDTLTRVERALSLQSRPVEVTYLGPNQGSSPT